MRLLDLFCGHGLAAWGYWRSGCFSEIVGVDLDPGMSTRYAFDFVCGDALALDYEFLDTFDYIHASPPCQAYSKRTRNKAGLPRLVAATRHMLHATGKPHVVENVEGSGIELRPNLVMDGHYFGLPIERRRYFYVSALEAPLRLMSMSIDTQIHIHADKTPSRADVIRAMGLECVARSQLSKISVQGMLQGIPPAMTQHIARLTCPALLIG